MGQAQMFSAGNKCFDIIKTTLVRNYLPTKLVEKESYDLKELRVGWQSDPSQIPNCEAWEEFNGLSI